MGQSRSLAIALALNDIFNWGYPSKNYHELKFRYNKHIYLTLMDTAKLLYSNNFTKLE